MGGVPRARLAVPASNHSIRLWRLEHVSARGDLELIVPVLRPRSLVVARGDRTLFAVADDRDPAVGNAMLGQIPLGGFGTALAEGQIVLVGSSGIAVAGDANRDTRVGGEDRNLGREGRLVLIRE